MLPEDFWADDPEPVRPPTEPVEPEQDLLPGSRLRQQQFILAALAAPAGRQKLAAAMVAPLKTRRDYKSIGQKLFTVEQMPPGALPLYDKSLDVLQHVLPEESEDGTDAP